MKEVYVYGIDSQNKWEVTESEGNYTFKMPEEDVIIEVTFEKIPEEPVIPEVPETPEDPGQEPEIPEEKPEDPGENIEIPGQDREQEENDEKTDKIIETDEVSKENSVKTEDRTSVMSYLILAGASLVILMAYMWKKKKDDK